MKRTILTTILSIIALVVFAAGEADIKFEKTTHDFGSFPESQKVTCTFKFTNTGDNLLVIHQAIASCGCTVPKYSKEPIKPGPRVKAMALSCSFSTPALFKASCTTGTIFCW